jgi:hypothetical protein
MIIAQISRLYVNKGRKERPKAGNQAFARTWGDVTYRLTGRGFAFAGAACQIGSSILRSILPSVDVDDRALIHVTGRDDSNPANSTIASSHTLGKSI